MDACQHHKEHAHHHAHGCGHYEVMHDGHKDHLHDGHLHHQHGDHVDDHSLLVSHSHPEACTPEHECGVHPKAHRHGAGCGHAAVPHGSHVDYWARGHLHHGHDGHCDDHGKLPSTK
ncbi:MAG TPA: hypothetical protein VJ874_02310 [Candidatus Thermoplasmatota archaeon]|nr:hypothetical protein [Candidatus Thermoplasmatota archaeon]